MDILLCNPYYTQPVKYYSFFRPSTPIGIMYIAAFLKKSGIDAKLCEFGIFNIKDAIVSGGRARFGVSDDHIERVIKRENPKIVGLTCMYSIYYRDVVEIAKTIKKINPEITIVLGGNHASSYWSYLLKDKNIDYVAIGEGEQTFLELASNLLSGKSCSEVSGIAYRNEDGQIVATGKRALIQNLDDIPFPLYEALDYERYLENSSPFIMRPPVAGIVSSRGCPGNCIYCTVKAVWGRSWRGRSPKNVVDEIKFLNSRYAAREVAFLDDSASIDRDRWLGICDEIIKERLSIKWTTPNGIAHWTLNRDILDKMKESGCYRITLGIESGDEETRKFLGKPYSLKQAKELIQYANRIGMWTICTNIIGFPYEKLDSMQATVNFAKECDTDFATFYLLIPQPTSDVYRCFKDEMLLDFDDFFESTDFNEKKFEEINYVLNETGCDTVYFKKEELNQWQKKAYRSFIAARALSYLFNPLKLIRKIHSAEDLGYLLRLLSKGVTIFLRTMNPMFKKSSDYLYEKSTEELGRSL